jgi:two-component system, response regulator PdtaR
VKGIFMASRQFDYCIGTANPGLKKTVTSILREAGFLSLGEGKNIPELLRLLRVAQPWLTIIDTELPPGNIKQLAAIIDEDGLAAALYINTGNTDLNNHMTLKWPVEAPVLAAVAEALCLEFARKQKLQKQVKGLEEKLAHSKEIAKAKGILMKELHIDEDHAYRYLQQESMKRRVNIIETARRVITDPDRFYS